MVPSTSKLYVSYVFMYFKLQEINLDNKKMTVEDKNETLTLIIPL